MLAVHKPAGASCCDDEGLRVSRHMAALRRTDPQSHDLLVEYYVLKQTLTRIAGARACSQARISGMLRQAECRMETMLLSASGEQL